MTEETDPAAQDAGTSNRLRPDAPYVKTFFALLANTLLVCVINFTVWFAISFYGFLETAAQRYVSAPADADPSAG